MRSNVQTAVAASLLATVAGFSGPSIHGHTGASKLPKIDDVLSRPAGALKSLTSQVTELNNRLDAASRHTADALRRQKSEYEARLTAQERENMAVARKNSELETEVVDLDRDNVQLRDHAVKLRASANQLAHVMRSLQANMSIAQEFIANTLESSGEMLTNAPEMDVLKELAQEDKSAKEEEAHRKRLTQINVSMLSINVQERTHDIDAKDLLQSLASAMEELSEQQNASQAALTKTFDEQFRAGEERLRNLLARQAELETKKTAASELRDRLAAAVRHLEGLQQMLLTKNDALRAFVTKIAASEKTKKKVLSLLQAQGPDKMSKQHASHGALARHAEGKPKPVHSGERPPREPVALLAVAASLSTEQEPVPQGHPKQAYNQMKVHVSEFEERLAEEQKETEGTMSKQRKSYEAQLAAKWKEEKDVHSQNQAIAASIQEVKNENLKLKLMAKKIQKLNAQSRQRLVEMKFNLSTAMEFTEGAMNTSRSMLHTAPEVEVLEEFARGDAEKGEALAHEQRLSEITALKPVSIVSLMETRSNRAAPDPQDLLQSLASAFEELQQEQNRSLVILQKDFDSQYQAAEERIKTKLQKQVELNTTLDSEVERRKGLLKANEHLKDTFKKLSDKLASLKGFLAKLSETPVPSRPEVQAAKLLQTEGATQTQSHQKKHPVSTKPRKHVADTSTKNNGHKKEQMELPEKHESSWLDWITR